MSAKESQKSTSLGTAAWLDGIDGENLPRLITSDKSVIRVVAGPGSGKTLGLQRRVQRLIQADSVDPSKIFVGTFTRAITAELAVSLGDQLAKGIEVSTLHSLAYRLLRDNPHVFQGRALRFLLNFETSPMLYDVGHMLSDSSTQADRGRLLRRLQADYAHKREAGEAMFAGEVDRWLRRHGGMLIDEIVPFATRAMENHDIKQGMFDHVLIDEYQDLTASEQALVELVWSRKGSLVIFGDDDQRIYGFRFSNPGGITEFADRWDKDDFEDITIPDNHRSGSDIVGAANTMMAEAGPSKEEMVPKFPESGSVLRVIWSNLEDEIAGLATYIKSRPEQDFLVLVPLRVIGYRLQEAVGEDAQTSFSEGLLEHYVVQERFTLASVIANPDDRIARRTWFGFRGDGANPAPQRNNVAYLSAIESELPGIDLIQAIADSRVSIKGNGKNHVIARAKRLLEYQASMPVDLNEKIEYLFDSACAGEVDDEEKREWAVKDLDAIRKGALGLLEDDEISDLAGVMNKLRYQIATRDPVQQSVSPRVRITTLHSAKGLQADAVIIAGLADQILPGLTADAEESEEKRRLLYVAVTRARKELIVSRPRAMRFEDAKQNNVRIDRIITRDGERQAELSVSRFIPSDFPGPIKQGQVWLRETGLDAT